MIKTLIITQSFFLCSAVFAQQPTVEKPKESVLLHKSKGMPMSTSKKQSSSHSNPPATAPTTPTAPAQSTEKKSKN